MRRTWLLASVIPATLCLTSCAEEVKDVNRVQPYALKKNLLEGEWYYRQTVVDVPPDVGIGFTGLESKVEKIRFDFQQGSIFGRRVHEAIEGLNDLDTAPGGVFEGDTVFTVDGVEHFDIIRDFNYQSGETTNVLVEDGALKPWWERSYFRADWSTSSAFGFDFAGIFASFATASYAPKQDEIFNPDHLQIDLEDGTINFTQSFTVSDGGYTCFMEYGFYRSSTNTRNSCGTGEVKIRHSFRRIDQEDAAQFEPRRYLDRDLIRDEDGKLVTYITVPTGAAGGENEYVDVECTPDVLAALGTEYSAEDCHALTHANESRFGFFRTERYAANRRTNNGHDENRNFYANHHKIWEQVFEWEYEDGANGEQVIKTVDGKPVLKRDANGSPVVIPVKDRVVRPIVYHLNVGYPDDLAATAEVIEADWNKVFSAAIASAKGITTAQLAADLLARTGHPEAFRIDRNDCNVQGITDYLKRVTALKDVADEATHGEALLPGNLERVCSALTSESRDRGLEKFTYQQVGDVRFSFIYWVNEDQPGGPLGFGPSGADPETGRILSGNAYVYGAAIDSYARDSVDVVRALNEELDDEDIFSGKTYTDWIATRNRSVAEQPVEMSQALRAEIDQRFAAFQHPNLEKVQLKSGKIDLSAISRDARARNERRSPDDPFFGGDVTTDRTEGLRELIRSDARIRSRLLPRPMMAMLGRLFKWDPTDHPGEDLPEEMLDAAVELALDPGAMGEHMQKRNQFYLERNVTLADFVDDSVYGLAVSLKGKSPEEVYKTVREEIFRGVMLHEIGHTLGLTHNFKASFDALNYFDDFWSMEDSLQTDAEKDEARQPEYRYSSIMDYGARFNSDIQGLGKYDYAAVKYGYTGLVEQFDESVTVPGRLDLQMEYGDWKNLPALLGGTSGTISKRVNIDAMVATADRRQGIKSNASTFVANPASTADAYWKDRTVPYFYCIDWFNGRDPKCRTWDEGPTHEEAVRSSIQRYWNYYFFSNWRRGRDDYQFYFGLFNRMGRMRNYLDYPYKYFAYFQQFKNSDGTVLPVTEDLLRAAKLGSDFTMQVIGTPEPGRYCKANAGTQFAQALIYVPNYFFDLEYQRGEQCDAFDVNVGLGRDFFIDLSDDYDTKWDYMGTYFEKQSFAVPLLNNGLIALYIDNEYGLNRNHILATRFGYYDVFKDNLLRLVDQLMQGGLGNITHRPYQIDVTENADNEKSFKFNSFLDFSQVDDRLTEAGGSVPPADTRVQIWANIPFDLMNYYLYASTILNSRLHDRKLDFYEYIAVYELGSGDDSTHTNGQKFEDFIHPKTGQTLRAYDTTDGLSLAYGLMRRTNTVLADWEDAKVAFERDPSDAGLRETYGTAESNLEFYLGLVDDMRYLRSVLDLGK